MQVLKPNPHLLIKGPLMVGPTTYILIITPGDSDTDRSLKLSAISKGKNNVFKMFNIGLAELGSSRMKKIIIHSVPH